LEYLHGSRKLIGNRLAQPNSPNENKLTVGNALLFSFKSLYAAVILLTKVDIVVPDCAYFRLIVQKLKKGSFLFYQLIYFVVFEYQIQKLIKNFLSKRNLFCATVYSIVSTIEWLHRIFTPL
jgi:hypothetical protein